jgi:predicted nucleotidyltransferase
MIASCLLTFLEASVRGKANPLSDLDIAIYLASTDNCAGAKLSL